MSAPPRSGADLNKIQAKYGTRLKDLTDKVAKEGRDMLKEDIADPRLTGKAAPNHDAFMSRANRVGWALFDAGLYSRARKYYDSLQELTEKYREENDWRHAGALLSNRGLACWLAGDVDRAVESWVQAATVEDGRTYGIAMQDSFAMNGLYKKWVCQPACEFGLQCAQLAERNVSAEDVELLVERLRLSQDDALEFALMDLLTDAERPSQMGTRSSGFSTWRRATVLRNIGCLLEFELRLLGHTGDDLYNLMTDAFSGNAGWKAIAHKLCEIACEKKNSGDSDEKILGKLLNLPNATPTKRFKKSFVVAYKARNFMAHDIDSAGPFADKHALTVIGHVLHVMIAAARLDAGEGMW